MNDRSIEMTECARHPGTEAYISCQRCSRPICPQCQIQAAVGFQCPDCVKGAAKNRRAATTVLGGRLTDGRPLLTIGVVVGAAVLMLLGQIPLTRWVYHLLALSPTAGELYPWRYLTYSVLGGGTFIPILSLFATYVLGRELEPQFGRARLAASWVVTALAGSVVFSLAASPNAALHGTAAPTLGLAVAWFVIHKGRLPVRGLTASVWVLLVVINAPWVASLACMAAGAAVGGILLTGRQRRSAAVAWGGLAGLGGILLVAALLISLL